MRRLNQHVTPRPPNPGKEVASQQLIPSHCCVCITDLLPICSVWGGYPATLAGLCLSNALYCKKFSDRRTLGFQEERDASVWLCAFTEKLYVQFWIRVFLAHFPCFLACASFLCVCALIKKILLCSRVYDTIMMHFAVPSIGFFPCSFFSVRKENLNDRQRWGKEYKEYVSFGGSTSLVGAWVVEVVGRADTVQCVKAVWVLGGFFLGFFLPLLWDLFCYSVCLWALGFCYCRESAQLSLYILSGDKNTWHWRFSCLTDCTVWRDFAWESLPHTCWGKCLLRRFWWD